MLDGATKSYTYAYNAQAAVDSHGQIIVAAVLTQEANDQRQLVPMLEQVKKNLDRMPEQASADTGYFSDAAVTDKKVAGVNLLVPPRRKKDSEEDQTEEAATEQIAVEQVAVQQVAADSDTPSTTEPHEQPVGESTPPPAKSAAETMRDKLRTEAGKAVYKLRKAIVEPVFGQLKAVRGLRGFSMRGLEKVSAEWQIMCLTHNLMKCFRAEMCPKIALAR